MHASNITPGSAPTPAAIHPANTPGIPGVVDWAVMADEDAFGASSFQVRLALL